MKKSNFLIWIKTLCLVFILSFTSCTLVDSQSIAPLKYYKNVQEDNYKDEDLVYYDHEKKWMTGTKKSMNMPAYLQDLVSGMFYARTLDLQNAKVGETFPLDIYLDQEIYNLKFKYMGKETLKTEIGKVRCIKLIPQLVVDRVFKDEDDMTVWVSDDANKIPIRVKAEIYVGSVKVDITSYQGLKNNFSSKLYEKTIRIKIGGCFASAYFYFNHWFQHYLPLICSY